MNSLSHWMIFSTFAEQRYFKFPDAETYDGVIINANMVTHAAAGLAQFLLEKTGQLPYLIDPLTHAFQHDPTFIQNDEGQVKRSVESLIKAYGGVIQEYAGGRPLLPSDFGSGERIDELVQGVYGFQASYLADRIRDSDLVKYFVEEPTATPHAIVSPYFYVTKGTLSYWAPILRQCLAKTKSLCSRNGYRAFGQLTIGKGVLTDSKSRDELIETYTSTSMDGYVVWVDDFDEHTADSDLLEGLLYLSKRLRATSQSTEVINKHGSYFSVLAAGAAGKRALTGVAHAPEFGEHRPVVPVGGGIPIAKYYVPVLHDRLKYRDAAYLFNRKDWLSSADVFHSAVCGCDTCREVIEGDPNANFPRFGESNAKSVRRGSGLVRMEYPTQAAKKNCLKHYLHRKKIEYKKARDGDPLELLNELTTSASDLQDSLGLSGVEYLRTWSDVLSGWIKG